MAVTTSLAQPGELTEITGFCAKWLTADQRYFELRLAHDPTMLRERILVARDGDTLVSTVRLFDIGIRTGGRTIRCGGVGDVCTHGEWRNRGLATILLNEIHRLAREDGYPLTALTSEYHDFYRRSGYECWDRRGTIFTLRDIPGAPPGSVRNIDFTGDQSLLREIYSSWTGRLAAYPVRPPEFWTHHHEWTALYPGEDHSLALTAGNRAYARCTSHGGALRVIEFGCLPGTLEAGVRELANALVREAVSRKGGRIRIPAVCTELTAILEGHSYKKEADNDLSLMFRITDPAGLEGTSGGHSGPDAPFPPPGAHFWETDGW